jgi:methylamine dehydrogenase accessory protein MauD
VLASDGEREEHERFVAAQSLGDFPYVLSQELGMTYRVAKLPYAVLIDAAGVVRAKGLINTREHLESLLEARDRGVASIQEFLHAAHQHPGPPATPLK